MLKHALEGDSERHTEESNSESMRCRVLSLVAGIVCAPWLPFSAASLSSFSSGAATATNLGEAYRRTLSDRTPNNTRRLQKN
jgi:hypothetical protein